MAHQIRPRQQVVGFYKSMITWANDVMQVYRDPIPHAGTHKGRLLAIVGNNNI